MYFWIARFSGRAPYASSYPFFTRNSVAAVGELERQLVLGQPLPHVLEQDRHDLRDVLAAERVEHDHVVEAVQELRVEDDLELFLHLLLHPLERRRACRPCAKPSPLPFVMSRAPTFDVMITTVFLKSITRP